MKYKLVKKVSKRSKLKEGWFDPLRSKFNPSQEDINNAVNYLQQYHNLSDKDDFSSRNNVYLAYGKAKGDYGSPEEIEKMRQITSKLRLSHLIDQRSNNRGIPIMHQGDDAKLDRIFKTIAYMRAHNVHPELLQNYYPEKFSWYNNIYDPHSENNPHDKMKRDYPDGDINLTDLPYGPIYTNQGIAYVGPFKDKAIERHEVGHGTRTQNEILANILGSVGANNYQSFNSNQSYDAAKRQYKIRPSGWNSNADFQKAKDHLNLAINALEEKIKEALSYGEDPNYIRSLEMNLNILKNAKLRNVPGRPIYSPEVRDVLYMQEPYPDIFYGLDPHPPQADGAAEVLYSTNAVNGDNRFTRDAYDKILHRPVNFESPYSYEQQVRRQMLQKKANRKALRKALKKRRGL